jgi:predicted DNA-binding transcriptional regulator AlpA
VGCVKKISDLKEGDLLTLDAAHKLLGVAKKTLYEWSYKSRLEPEKYPRTAKIGGTIFFLKSDLIERINREFAKKAS